MTFSETVGYRIATARNSLRMSQDQLGELVGVKKQTISGWENGRNMPNAERLALLSKELGCSVDYLLGLVDAPRGRYGNGGI